MREMTSLKASVEPMLIRPRRQAIVVVRGREGYRGGGDGGAWAHLVGFGEISGV